MNRCDNERRKCTVHRCSVVGVAVGVGPQLMSDAWQCIRIRRRVRYREGPVMLQTTSRNRRVSRGQMSYALVVLITPGLRHSILIPVQFGMLSPAKLGNGVVDTVRELQYGHMTYTGGTAFDRRQVDGSDWSYSSSCCSSPVQPASPVRPSPG